LIIERKYFIKVKGLTLVEIIVVVAVSAIILGAIYSFFISNFKVAQENIQIARIDSEAKRLNDQLKQWLGMADQQTIQYVDLGTTKKIMMDVYQNDTPALQASPDFKVEIIYVPSDRKFVFQKTYLTSAGSPNVPSPAQFEFLKGVVKSFNCQFVSATRLLIEYEVVVRKRGSMEITKVYKIEHILRTF